MSTALKPGELESRQRHELRNGRIVHLERHNTEPGPLLEMVLLLDEVTYALLKDWTESPRLLVGEERQAYGQAVGRARALAECITILLQGEYTLTEVKTMNVLRYERHSAEAAAELEDTGAEP